MELAGNFLRDLTLNCEQIIQIAVILLDPNVSIRARVDQLRIHVKPCPDLADAALQNVRYAQIITDLADIPFTAIIHHAGSADHFQIGDPRQLGQNVVLDTLDEGTSIFSLLAQIFKRRTAIPVTSGCQINSLFQTITANGTASASNIAAMTAMLGLRRTHFLPRTSAPTRRALIGSCFSQRSKSSASASADESALWIFFQTFEANGREIAIDSRIQQPWRSRLGFFEQLDSLVSCTAGKRRLTCQ